MSSPISQLPVRIGVADVGSNAIRFLIAELGGADTPEDPGLRVLHNHRAALRLGRDVFLTGSIPEESLDAAVETFAQFRTACDDLGVQHIRAIATSATRDAANGDRLVQRIADRCGIRLEVISGSEEAYLLHVAVSSRAASIATGRSLLVDLGGGSVETCLVQDGGIVAADSYRLGALRLLRALAVDDSQRERPQDETFLELLGDYVAALEGRIIEAFGVSRPDRYIATGGNIESIADLCIAQSGKHRQVDGVDAIALDDIRELTKKLVLLSHSERVETYGLKPDRADTILPAAVVYWRLGRTARVDEVLVPRVGLRDGLLQEVVSGHIDSFKATDHRETLLSACRALAERYRVDEEHAEIVRQHAVTLFDGTQDLHRLESGERTLLEAAALAAHDIGAFVNNQRHHKHSYYLIRESDIVGLSDEEREVVALVARYHRRAHPTRKHEPVANMTDSTRERVARLAALLRVADCLDRGHRRRIIGIDVTRSGKRLDLVPTLAEGVKDVPLERMGIEDKGRLFAELFGLKPRLVGPT